VEKAYFLKVYRQLNQNKSCTCRLLGIGMNTLSISPIPVLGEREGETPSRHSTKKGVSNLLKLW
jgi:hypothetical protein